MWYGLVMSRKTIETNVEQMPLVGVFMKVAMLAREQVWSQVAREKWFIKDSLRLTCIGVIHAISIMQPVSQKDVANLVRVDPSDLVGILDELENAGYVERKRDSKDRRRQLLSLTKKGIEARKKLELIGAESMDKTLAPLEDGEREILRALLLRVLIHHESMDLQKES